MGYADFILAFGAAFFGFCIGLIVGGYAITPDDMGACRAANPGYECVIGYVRGEAFQ